VCVRETRDTEQGTLRHLGPERQTERKRDRERDRETDRHTERERERERGSYLTPRTLSLPTMVSAQFLRPRSASSIRVRWAASASRT
jgi:hypothetical protein